MAPPSSSSGQSTNVGERHFQETQMYNGQINGSSSSGRKLRKRASSVHTSRTHSETQSTRSARPAISRNPSSYSIQSTVFNDIVHDGATGILSIPPAYRINQEGFNEGGRYPTVATSTFSENARASQAPVTRTASAKSYTPAPSIRRESIRSEALEEPARSWLHDKTRSSDGFEDQDNVSYMTDRRKPRHPRSTTLPASLGRHGSASEYHYADPSWTSGQPRMSTVPESLRRNGSESEYHYAEPSPIPLGRANSWDLPSRPRERSSYHEGSVGLGRRRDPWNDRASETIEAVVHEQEYEDDFDINPEMYHYIVPAGAKVIFQDVEGNVITRIGPKVRKQEMNPHVRSVPIIVHDEFGKELYRTQQYNQPIDSFNRRGDAFYSRSTSHASFGGLAGRATSYDSRGYHRPPWLSDSSGSLSSSSSTKTIIVDEKGNQFPLRSRSISRERPTRLQQPLFQDMSYHGDVYDA